MNVKMDKRHQYKPATNQSVLGALAVQIKANDFVLLFEFLLKKLGLSGPVPIIARSLENLENVNVKIFNFRNKKNVVATSVAVAMIQMSKVSATYRNLFVADV